MASWIIAIIAVGAIVYNIIEVRILLKNDLKHLKETNEQAHARIEKDIREIRTHLFEKD